MAFVKDYDTYFEKYLGRIFFRIIRKHKINNINTVIEFAPGFRYKIAYALKSLKFNGTLYIIDTNKNVLEFVKKRYQRILPGATIICINKGLVESLNDLPKRVDLFLTNHSIDDMIVAEYVGKEKLSKAFDNDDDSKQFLIDCWNELSRNDKDLSNIKNIVIKEWEKFLNSIDINFIVLSQYKSGYYVNQKNHVEDLTRNIFLHLKENIITDNLILDKAMDFPFADFDVCLQENGYSLKDNIQNSKNWIAGVFKRT